MRVSKKPAANKRASLQRRIDYTRDFVKDWKQPSLPGRYDMNWPKAVMLLLIASDSRRSGLHQRGSNLAYTEPMFQPRSRRYGWAVSLAASTILMCALGSAFAAGPEVGERVPTFEAIDHSGDARDFESLAGERGLLLLFFRSADW